MLGADGGPLGALVVSLRAARAVRPYAAVRRAFAALDPAREGAIDEGALAGALRRIGLLSSADAIAAVRAADANGDGKLSLAEFERLYRALEQKMFEDQKDSIKLTSIVSNAADRETQEKIDVVKQRLIRDFGYNEESATDVLTYVASIFARGDTRG